MRRLLHRPGNRKTCRGFLYERYNVVTIYSHLASMRTVTQEVCLESL